MATTITFVSGATTVTLPGPPGGYPEREVKFQAMGLTLGGKRYVYDKGVAKYEAEITLESLTAAQKTALDSFYHTTVNGSRETFTYTDTTGTAYAARFLNQTLDYTKVSKECFDITLQLELGAMAG